MRNFLGILMFLVLAISFSCEKKGLIVNCSDCYTTEPDKTTLSIKVDETGYPVEINVYEGNLEDSILYSSALVTWTPYNINDVPLNKKYTVTAKYVMDGNTYIAVGSATPGVKYAEDQCDDPCYFVYDKVINLRLKYTVSGK